MPTVEERELQTFAAFEGKVQGNSVKGVSLLQKGPALGHGMWVDNVMLEQAKRSAQGKGKIKAKVNHWSGLEDTVGYYENFRIRAGKLVADLNLFESTPQSAHLLEMIGSIPESFGVSIMFAADEPEYSKDEDKYFARVRELYSADFVDTPAANRDGVFEAEIDNADEDNMPAITVEAFDAHKSESAAAIAALTAQVAELKAALEAKQEPAPAPAPQPAGFSAEQLQEAVTTALKAHFAAPPTKQEPAQVNEPETAPEPPKSYADARKEAIGTATGLARLTAIRKFEEKHPSEAAYRASFKL